MAKTIIYNNHTYTESEIKSISAVRSKSMVSEECSIDTLTVEFYSEDLPELFLMTNSMERFCPADYTDGFCISTGVDIRNFTPFAPVQYFDGSVCKGKFYVTNIERESQNWFKMEACSAVGILDKKTYVGGLFTGKSFSQHLQSIIGDSVTYSVDSAIASLPVSGWIPYETAREALMQVCFALGVAITYDLSGNLLFKYNQPDSSIAIADSEIYLGGSAAYPTKAKKVTVIEHAWYQDSTVQEDVLYDNTDGSAVTDALITFSDPYHSLAWTGTSMTEISCNCCRVTGQGQLTGKKYAHTQKECVAEDSTAEGEEMTVSDAYLVSSINSASVLARVWNFYHNHNEVSCSVVSEGNFKTGDLISFTDPFGEEKTGYVMEMDETASATCKADIVLATDWVPSNLGNDYTHSLVVKASDLVSGVWTKPAAITGKMLVVLFSGFGGGQAGYDGTDGEEKEFTSWRSAAESYVPANGTGGEAGACGDYGKYIVSAIESPAASYNVSFGTGGAGGASNGALGSAGTHSTFGTLDTDNGTTPSGPYINLITGEKVTDKGSNGYAGADGGETMAWNTPDMLTTPGASGGNVGVYSGGLGATGHIDDSSSNYYYSAPAGGGGAAYGANGSAASIPSGSDHGPTRGGNGANATAPSDASLGRTGSGGNGGGGGGAGGICYFTGSYGTSGFNSPGDGGSGSAGGKGSDGFAVIYY